MPIRIGILAPARYPDRIRSTDLRQGLQLAQHLQSLSSLPCEVTALPTPVALPAVLVPLAAARLLGRISAAVPAGEGRRLIQQAMDRSTGIIATPRSAYRGLDAVIGHGLIPWPRPDRRTAVVWGPGLLPSHSHAPDVVVDPRRAGHLLDQLRRRACHTDAVFLNERGTEAEWTATVGAPSRVRFIPPISTGLPRSGDARPPARTPTGTLEVLFVGGEARRKNLPRVIEACGRLVGSGRAVRLTVVSNLADGPVDVDAPWVRHLGSVPPGDVLRLMRESDVLCVPSTWESFGLVYVEAMAAGLPVIGPDLPIQRANLAPAALLVPPTDTEALTAALESMRDPDERARRSEAGWALYAHHFAPDVIATAHVRLCMDARD